MVNFSKVTVNVASLATDRKPVKNNGAEFLLGNESGTRLPSGKSYVALLEKAINRVTDAKSESDAMAKFAAAWNEISASYHTGAKFHAVVGPFIAAIKGADYGAAAKKTA